MTASRGSGYNVVMRARALRLAACVAAAMYPPAVHLHPQTIRAGRLARLDFRAADAGTQRTRELLTVSSGRRAFVLLQGHGFTNEAGGGSYLWHVPRGLAGRTLRYCMSASDWYGNISTSICTPLRVR
jgi:hypothetical protein